MKNIDNERLLNDEDQDIMTYTGQTLQQQKVEQYNDTNKGINKRSFNASRGVEKQYDKKQSQQRRSKLSDFPDINNAQMNINTVNEWEPNNKFYKEQIQFLIQPFLNNANTKQDKNNTTDQTSLSTRNVKRRKSQSQNNVQLNENEEINMKQDKKTMEKDDDEEEEEEQQQLNEDEEQQQEQEQQEQDDEDDEEDESDSSNEQMKEDQSPLKVNHNLILRSNKQSLNQQEEDEEEEEELNNELYNVDYEAPTSIRGLRDRHLFAQTHSKGEDRPRITQRMRDNRQTDLDDQDE